MDLACVDVTSSITLARDRYLPVDEAFATLLPDPGLIRGRIVGCGGAAATSLALAIASRATMTGSWLAVVGMSPVGIEAASELGVAIDRLVSIDADRRQPGEWADRVAAAADGFELILAVPPAHAERVIRKVRQRIQARGAVLLAVCPGAVSSGGDSSTVGSGIGADVMLEVTAGEWEGLGRGHGHLRRRRVVVRARGRRVPRPVECQLWLPGITGRAESIEPATTATTTTAVTAVTVGGGALERAG